MLTKTTMATVVFGFRNCIGETARESTGSRRDWKEEAHRRLLVGLDAHGGDGNDEAAKKFSTGRGRGGSEATAWGTPGLGVEVVEDVDVLTMMLGCSTVAEELHGMLSTASPCAVHPPTPDFRGEKKGERRWRREGGRRRKPRAAARLLGGFL